MKMRFEIISIMGLNEFPMIPSLFGDGKNRKTITELKCLKCNHIQTRDFKVGDYIFKKVMDEKCDKCGSSKLVIDSVHDIIAPR